MRKEILSQFNCFFIPLKVINVERDIVKAKTGTGDELVYTKIIGLDAELAVQKTPSLLKNEEEIEKISDNGSSDSGSDEGQLYRFKIYFDLLFFLLLLLFDFVLVFIKLILFTVFLRVHMEKTE